MGSIHREIEEREGPCVLGSGQMGEAVRMEVSRNNEWTFLSTPGTK